MNELIDLYTMQKIALRAGDFATLNAINQRIFEIREQRRKEKSKQRQQERDNKTADKIDKILTL